MQFKKFLKELLDPHYSDNREHVEKPLDEKTAKAFLKTPVALCVAIELNPTQDLIKEIRKEFQLREFVIVSGLIDSMNYLDYGTKIWSSEEESELARKIISEISYSLYSDRNNWTEELKKDRLLGYGNLGKLTVFQHNVPKSLLPVLWKYGEFNKRSWFPLFPERRDWREYKKKILTYDPYKLFFAEAIVSGAIAKGSAVCSASIASKEEYSDRTTVGLGNDDIIEAIYDGIVKELNDLEYETFHETGHFHGLPLSPSGNDYKRYNKEVDNYNKDLGKYKYEIGKISKKLASVFSLSFNIENYGTAPANEVILRIELPRNVVYMESIDIIPFPPKRPELSGGLSTIKSIVGAKYSWLGNISATLESIDKGKRDRVKSYVRNKRRFIEIYFGKIVQHTSRSWDLKYLRVSSYGSSELDYQLIWEEASYPVEGKFEIHFCPGQYLHDDVLKVIEDFMELGN